MRLLGIVLGMMVAFSAMSQDAAPKKKKKSPAEAKAHQKPTKDQIRRFNDLQKKQQP